VFGIGMQEMVIIGLVLLIVFGPEKLPGMVHDFGRFLGDARRTVEEFKQEIVSENEGGQELVEGHHEPEVGHVLEEGSEREEDEVVPPNASRIGQGL
jgi:sec-independent protein translocase protein TatB